MKSIVLSQSRTLQKLHEKLDVCHALLADQ